MPVRASGHHRSHDGCGWLFTWWDTSGGYLQGRVRAGVRPGRTVAGFANWRRPHLSPALPGGCRYLRGEWGRAQGARVRPGGGAGAPGGGAGGAPHPAGDATTNRIGVVWWLGVGRPGSLLAVWTVGRPGREVVWLPAPRGVTVVRGEWGLRRARRSGLWGELPPMATVSVVVAVRHGVWCADSSGRRVWDVSGVYQGVVSGSVRGGRVVGSVHVRRGRRG